VILAIGADHLEISRVERELSWGEWRPQNGTFTMEEIRYCASARRLGRHYAACFAAKEAALKALGVHPADLGMFREIEVRRDQNMEYRIILHGRMKDTSMRLGVKRIKLSVTCDARAAGAIVILENG
jgi:holo-[acyl-carrier protein] synthase